MSHSCLVSVIFLASTSAALKLNTPVIDSNSMELWNQTAFMLFGPYWSQHSAAQRTVMLRQLVSSGSSSDLARKVTMMQSEKMRRARRTEETGVEVIPGCGEGEPCTAKSYYEAVLLQSGDSPGDDDCCDVLWGDCLQASLASCMKTNWDAETDMNQVDVSLIVTTEWKLGPSDGFSKFVSVPTSSSEHAHAHSLLQKSESRHHGECAAKACTWCAKHGYHAAHQQALQALSSVIAPPQLDQICYLTPDEVEDLGIGKIAS